MLRCLLVCTLESQNFVNALIPRSEGLDPGAVYAPLKLPLTLAAFVTSPCDTTVVDMAQQRGQAMGDTLKTAHSVSLKVLRYVVDFPAQPGHTGP